MRTTLQITRILLLTSTALVFTVGCVKKRPDQFAQGQGRYFKSIADFDGKEFDLKTGAAIRQASTTKASSVVIEDVKAGSIVEQFPLVQYSSSSPLLPKELELRARPNTTDRYKIRYQVTRDHLKILKVAKVEDIPFEERTSGVQEADGYMAVPIVGYPLTLHTIENIRNADNKSTHQLREESVQNVNEAVYFRINESKWERYKFQSKSETYPISFFGIDESAEWNYAETIIAGPGHLEPYTGIWLNSDSDRSNVSRVKFRRFNENEIEVINAYTPVGSSNGGIHNASVLKIPAAYFDYRPVEAGSETGMSEVEVQEGHYSQRQFVRLNLAQTESQSLNGDKELVEVRIGENYFTYVVQSKGKDRIRIRYSFHRKPRNENFKVRYAFPDDMKSFGLISRDIPFEFTDPSIRQTLRDAEKFKVAIRQGSNNITFHIADSMDDKYLPFAKKAVALWNTRLEAEGSQVRIFLSPERKSIGDVRANILDFVEPSHAGSWSGVSHANADVLTGEIISSITQVQMTAIKTALHHYLSLYMNFKLGVEDTFSLGERMTMSPEATIIGTINQSLASPLAANLKNTGLDGIFIENPGQSKDRVIKKSFEEFIKENEAEKSLPLASELSASNQIFCSTGVADKEFVETVDSTCKELGSHLAALKSANKNGNFSDVDFDKEIIEGCLSKLLAMEKYVLPTAVHEIGHSIGLDHNFKGSADKLNFYPEESGESGSSSIMDYFPSSRKSLIGPGKYDLAAVRFNYENKVQTKEGRYISIDTEKSLVTQGLKDKMRPFMACNNRDESRFADPRCQMFDSGTSILEITKNSIQDIKTMISQNTARLYRPSISSQGLTNATLRRTLPLRRIYEEWRYHLARYVGQNNQYLEKYNVAQYQARLKEMSEDPQFKEVFNEYYEASRLIFNFLLDDLYFLPNRYCLGQTKEGLFKAIEVDKIRSKLDARNSEAVLGCGSPAAIAEIERAGMTNVREVGFELYTSRDRADSMDVGRKPFDRAGTVGLRMNAMMLLTARASLHPNAAERGFTPNFADEPDLRALMHGKMRSRIHDGVVLPGVNQYLSQFEQETNLVAQGFAMYRGSLVVPGKPETNVTRNVPFQTYPTQVREYAERHSDYLQFGSYYIGAPSPLNSVSLAFIKEYKAIKSPLKIAPNIELLQRMLPVIDKALPPRGHQKTATLKNLVELFNGLDMIAMDLQKKGASIDGLNVSIDLILKTFPEAKSLFDRVAPQIKLPELLSLKHFVMTEAEKDAKDTQGAPSQERANQIFGTEKMLKERLGQKIFGQASTIDEQFVDFHNEAYKKRLQDAVRRAENIAMRYMQSPDEAEAQANLILRVLVGQ